MVDKNNLDRGYLYGRLCAVLKKAHESCGNKYARVNEAMTYNCPFQMSTALVQLPHCFRSIPAVKDYLTEIIGKLDLGPNASLPKFIPIEEQSRFMLGFEQEMSEIENSLDFQPSTTEISSHHAQVIQDNKIDNTIDDLKK